MADGLTAFHGISRHFRNAVDGISQWGVRYKYTSPLEKPSNVHRFSLTAFHEMKGE